MLGSRARGRRGMSMIEVMIAISVLAFVLLAFLSVVQSSATLSASSRESSVAAFQLQSALEATFAVPFDDFRALYVNDGPAPAGPRTDLVPDARDPDHPTGGAWTGHLGSLPNTATAGASSLLPDFCQRTKTSGAQNFTWKPTVEWVATDALPLRDQHMSITWADWDRVNSNPDWVEYTLTLTWINYKGKPQTDSITTRRSR